MFLFLFAYIDARCYCQIDILIKSKKIIKSEMKKKNQVFKT